MGRRHNTHDSRRYTDWINAAYDDLRAARQLIADDTLNNATAFHCQQCVEKVLKGFILFQNGYSPDGHNLPWLCRRAMEHDQQFSQWLDESVQLNRYYIESRYPTDVPTEIEDDQIPLILQMADDVFNYVVDLLHLQDHLEEWEAY